LVFDEPTSVLTPQETRALFQTIRNLKVEGKSVVYISHKLWEILEIADRITVLRRGMRQGTVERSEASPAMLTRLMFGEELQAAGGGRWEEPAGREAALLLQDVSALDDRGVPALNGVTLELRTGEILGVAGVEGNGQRELAEAIAGTRPVACGRIVLAGRDVTRWTPRQRRQAGLAYIPEDRDADGVGLELSVADNLIATRYHRRPLSAWGVLRGGAIARFCRARVERFGVRASGLAAKARTLSGGNLQRLVVAREAGESPRVLVAAHPTRGVDMSAIRSIHRALLELRDGGTGILLISGDLDEVLALSDRIATIYRGRITGVVGRHEADRERIGALMLGVEGRGVEGRSS
ncbi:MAG: ATP-binding cassette domain-containing protein, partial [Bacillota bacterium]